MVGSEAKRRDKKEQPMNATIAARLGINETCTARNRADEVPAHFAEQADDFAALLLQALDDALDAMAHPAPDQYLHLVAAQRRLRPAAARPGAGLRAGAAADPGNAALARELGAHLAFEILNCTRHYATLLGSIGDYERPFETSERPRMRRGAAAA